MIGPVFFPSGSGTAQMLAAFLTFGIAFLARPLGSALFGHFGDRIGRKSTLVASLLLMGVSTTLIGVLPGYDSIGVWAPILHRRHQPADELPHELLDSLYKDDQDPKFYH